VYIHDRQEGHAVNINITIRVVPFGSYELREVVHLGVHQPTELEREAVVLDPTTIADHVITSAPAQLLAA
jgi:hypothetical protein